MTRRLASAFDRLSSARLSSGAPRTAGIVRNASVEAAPDANWLSAEASASRSRAMESTRIFSSKYCLITVGCVIVRPAATGTSDGSVIVLTRKPSSACSASRSCVALYWSCSLSTVAVSRSLARLRSAASSTNWDGESVHDVGGPLRVIARHRHPHEVAVVRHHHAQLLEQRGRGVAVRGDGELRLLARLQRLGIRHPGEARLPCPANRPAPARDTTLPSSQQQAERARRGIALDRVASRPEPGRQGKSLEQRAVPRAGRRHEQRLPLHHRVEHGVGPEQFHPLDRLRAVPRPGSGRSCPSEFSM